MEEGYGGPVWHASAASKQIALPINFLQQCALTALEGVGDASKGQWEEWTGNAYHIRRRLTDQEQARVGEVEDIRGTEEQERRWLAVRPFLPAQYRDYKD